MQTPNIDIHKKVDQSGIQQYINTGASALILITLPIILLSTLCRVCAGKQKLKYYKRKLCTVCSCKARKVAGDAYENNEFEEYDGDHPPSPPIGPFRDELDLSETMNGD